jgi:hypothetical protein
MENLFNESGRYITNSLQKPVYQDTRNYFCLDEDVNDRISINDIYSNNKRIFDKKILISEAIFKEKIKILKKKILQNKTISNILNCTAVPFIIPLLETCDIGSNIEKIFLPALSSSYHNKFPEYKFENHIKYNLSEQIEFFDKKYQNYYSKSNKENIVGILFLCFNEFSFSAAEEACQQAQNNLILSGPYELLSSLIGVPNLLFKKEKYPPLLWCSSVRKKNNENIGYHIEPYGYNLNFNQRAHLNQVAEYWWHSASVLD